MIVICFKVLMSRFPGVLNSKSFFGNTVVIYLSAMKLKTNKQTHNTHKNKKLG